MAAAGAPGPEPLDPSPGGSGGARLGALLPRTHTAFLGRFARPTEVQALAVPLILAGRDVLLSAPTASGKTEAYAAPSVELLGASRRTSPALLVVSPTRALANDLKRRLEGPMHGVGVPFGRYTGEHKERVDGVLPEVVVTTPESLDSLLARRAAALRGVERVVLDEIHVLDGTPRGDQVRVLLERLERTANTRPQRIAASATVERPAELAARYLAEDAALVDVGGARAIRARFFAGTDTDSMALHLAELARAGLRKVLVFVNRRRDVDRLAGELPGRTPFGGSIFAHHGSLSRTAREGTERRYHDSPAAVAIATLTLELGIDIGTVDYVLLAGPPPGVASLLQRLGRGGRRGDTSRVGCAYADAGEERIFRTLLRCAKERRLCAPPYAFRPGVLVQQALVLAGGGGHVSAPALTGVLPPNLRARLPLAAAHELLDSLVVHGLLEAPRGGRYALAAGEERLYELGKRHSNFAVPAGIDLVDRLTGDVLASVDPRQITGRTQIGGRSVRQVRELEGRMLVDAAAGGEAARYTSDAAPLVSLPFARELLGDLGAEPGEMLQVYAGKNWILAHGLGTLGGLVLAEHLRSSPNIGALAQAGPYTLRLAKELRVLPPPTAELIERFVTRHAAELARLSSMGPFHHMVPEEQRREALRTALAGPTLLDFLAQVTLRTVEADPALLAVWEHL